MGERDKLASVQIAPHLAYWYDSELQNGGHLQYFLNRGIVEAREALDALTLLGASNQRRVLENAIEAYDQSGIDDKKPDTVDEYCNIALEEHFDELDSEYYDCTPDMTELLRCYLEAHVDDFIEFTDEQVWDPYELPWHTKLRFRIRRFFGLMP